MPDGILHRLDRRHLPPVLHHHRLGHAALHHGRADFHAGALRHGAQAGRERPPGKERAASSACSIAAFARPIAFTSGGVKHILAGASPIFCLRRHRRRDGVSFHARPRAFLPEEDQGILFVQVNTPPGATGEPHRGGAGRRPRLFSRRRKGLGRRRFHRGGFQLRRARAKFRPGLRAAEGLVAAARRGTSRAGHRPPGHGAFRARSRTRWPLPSLRRR